MVAWAFGLMLSMAVTAQPVPPQSARPNRPATEVSPPRHPAKAPLANAKTWRLAPRPAWVVEPQGTAYQGEVPTWPAASAAKRRELLVDVQSHFGLARPQTFVHTRQVALEAAALTDMNQPQIVFNPTYQSVQLHELAVWRAGRREDRLTSARIELMRRERRLEQRVIDGSETLLVVPADLRPGDVLEMAYSVEGDNPIFEGRIALNHGLASNVPVDLMHLRALVPTNRTVTSRVMGIEMSATMSPLANGLQSWSLVRRQTPAVVDETGVPPWFKVYPQWQLSEWAQWGDVDRWAQGLFRTDSAAVGPLMRERLAALRSSGLAGAALAAEVVKFVQDEVSYFSVSLGESSHRPKPPEATLAQRQGDCKDKVVLLNSLLTELGFDAKPALVSTYRHRGLDQFLPGPEQFDHVVTRLKLNGEELLLDATLQGQGHGLDRRGAHDFGRVLVVGEGQALQVAPMPREPLDSIGFEQSWDLRDAGVGARVTTTVTADGLMAERLRGVVGQGQLARVAEALAGGLLRVSAAGLRQQGEPELVDDRDANRLILRQRFEHPTPGVYEDGVWQLEFNAHELLEFLTAPTEPNRRYPFWLDTPRTVSSRLIVQAPRPVKFAPPAPTQVQDAAFRYSSQVQIEGREIVLVRRIERRSDEVSVAQLPAYREAVQRVRSQLSNNLKLALYDTEQLRPLLERQVAALPAQIKSRDDELASMALRFRLQAALHGEVLGSLPPTSPLRSKVLAERAVSRNLMGDFSDGLRDAEQALALQPGLADAQDARGVALVGLGRLNDAAQQFESLMSTPLKAGALNWLAALRLQAGDLAGARQAARESVASGEGGDRDFGLIWWQLADQAAPAEASVELQRRIDQVDGKRWPGAIVHYLAGRLSREQLLAQAGDNPHMARLQTAEACFYVAQQLLLRGETQAAKPWLERVRDQGAVMYREHTLATQWLARR